MYLKNGEEKRMPPRHECTNPGAGQAGMGNSMVFNRKIFTAFFGMTLAAIGVGVVGWLSSVEPVASPGISPETEKPSRTILQHLRREADVAADIQKSLSDANLSGADRLQLHYRARNHANAMAVLLKAGDAVVTALNSGHTGEAEHKALRKAWLEAKYAVTRWSAGTEKALTLYTRWENTAVPAPDALMAQLFDFRTDIYSAVATLNAVVFGDSFADAESLRTEQDCAFGHWLDACLSGHAAGAGNAAIHQAAVAVLEPHRDFHRRARALADKVRAGDGDSAGRLVDLQKTVAAAHVVIGCLDDLTAEVKPAKALYDAARRYSTTELETLYADASHSLNALVITRQAAVNSAIALQAAASARRTALSRWLSAATILLAVGLAVSLGWVIRSRRTAGNGSLSKTPILLSGTAGRFLAESSMLLRDDPADRQPAETLENPPAAESTQTPFPPETAAFHSGSSDRIRTPSARSPRNLPPGRKRPKPPVRPRHGKWLKGANGEA